MFLHGREPKLNEPFSGAWILGEAPHWQDHAAMAAMVAMVAAIGSALWPSRA